ncbi:MAG: uracil-DNA glycosylase [Gammaproteobacteria bacterium]|nr:uracil-DNA glycosylase [Gammaproteobacteria bacterium]
MPTPQSNINDQYLAAMGITQWVRRDLPKLKPVIKEPLVDKVADLDWETLEARAAVCTNCDLYKGRTQTVFGVGNRTARWMVIGGAPGTDDDKQGQPFAGAAGQLLNAMLLAIGLKRDEVYLVNMVKCRPPNNRDPLLEEVNQCESLLKRQIALVQPAIILVVGETAAQNILHCNDTISSMRGNKLSLPEYDIPVVVTYHPAHLLLSPADKRHAWQDLKLARKISTL